MRISYWSSDVCSSDLITSIGEAGGQRVDAVDDGMQAGAFATQFLRACRGVPYGGTFQFAAYFFKTFAFCSVVKDTPGRKSGGAGKRWTVRGGLGGGRVLKKKKKI